MPKCRAEAGNAGRPHRGRNILLAAVLALSGLPALAETEDGERLRRQLEPCAECHGTDGVSRVPGVPSLAGQNAQYLLEELEELRGTLRPSAVMGPIAAALEAEDLPAIADHFAALPYVRTPQAVDAGKAERGQDAYQRLCQLCHPDGGRAATYAEYPLLAGQDLAYMRATMDDILGGKRKANGLMLEMINLAPAEKLDEALHFFAAQQVKPEEVKSARIGSPTAKKRRFKPAHAN